MRTGRVIIVKIAYTLKTGRGIKMDKQKVLEKLNQSPDSIYLHDGCLVNVSLDKDKIRFRFLIEGYVASVNDGVIGQYPLLVDEVFEGIEIKDITFNGAVNLVCAEIMSNEYKEGVMRVSVMDDFRNFAEIYFSFQSFRWENLQSITETDVELIYQSADEQDYDNQYLKIEN